MLQGLEEDATDRREARLWRALIMAGSVGLTALFAYLAFWLGAWAFDTRRFAQHERRLARMLQQQPNKEQVIQGLADDGSPLVAAPRTPEELRRIAAERGGAKAGEIVAKGQRWPQVRVFRASDVLYFIYFDEAGVMRDFAYVSR